MAYGNPHKKKMSYSHNPDKMGSSHGSHKSHNSVSKAAEGVKTPYDGFVGQRQAYKITGEVVDQ